MRNKIGSKYDSNLDITDIAKLVRADIKADQKAGHLPAGKASVRVRRYSGGQSLDVTFTYDSRGGIGGSGDHRVDAERIQEDLQTIMDSYNYDKGDSMVDYFNVNFYGHAEVYGLSGERLR